MGVGWKHNFEDSLEKKVNWESRSRTNSRAFYQSGLVSCVNHLEQVRDRLDSPIAELPHY